MWDNVDKITAFFNPHLKNYKELRTNFELCDKVYLEICASIHPIHSDGEIHNIIEEKIRQNAKKDAFQNDMKDLLNV
jgi:hypothetical protein